VAGLGNQPEKFASDLGDDQSRYLLVNLNVCIIESSLDALCT